MLISKKALALEILEIHTYVTHLVLWVQTYF
jgi:hypothetical protein